VTTSVEEMVRDQRLIRGSAAPIDNNSGVGDLWSAAAVWDTAVPESQGNPEDISPLSGKHPFEPASALF
jgi:hypothetical protein